jgi:hypothetical protein
MVSALLIARLAMNSENISETLITEDQSLLVLDRVYSLSDFIAQPIGHRYTYHPVGIFEVERCLKKEMELINCLYPVVR